jgi:glutathione S-transferase
MAKTDLTVWGIRTPRTLRVHWILAEFGIPYTCRPIASRGGDTTTPEFLALNPKHKIPVFEHRDRVITESAAIVTYISEAFEPPEGFFVPTNARDRATLNEWCFFIMTELDALSMYVIRKHHDLHDVYGSAPAAVEAARNNFTELTRAVFGAVEKHREFLMTEGMSVADILLITCLQSAKRRNITMPNYLTDYNDRISQRPAFQKALEINNPKMTGPV